MSSSEAVLTRKERFWKCPLLRAKPAKSFAAPDVELSRRVELSQVRVELEDPRIDSL